MSDSATTPKRAILSHVAAKLLLLATLSAPFFLFLWMRGSLGMVGRGGYDEINFHRPTIEQFAHQLPWPDFTDYLSATTPGYHLFLAFLHKPNNVEASFLLSVLFTYLLLSTLLFYSVLKLSTLRQGPPGFRLQLKPVLCGVLICLPLFSSPYVVASGAWLLPDNLAWCGVTLIILLSMGILRQFRLVFVAAALLLVLVFVRQIHLWAAATLVAAAYCSAIQSTDRTSFALGEMKQLLGDIPKRFPRTALACLLSIPACLVLYYFSHLWHGLTPPTFQGQYPIDTSKPLLVRLFNAPAAPAFILALFGVFGTFYAGFWLPALIRSIKDRKALPLLFAAIVLALAFALIPATTESAVDGRWSGLWQFTTKFPVIGGHTSILLLGLAIWGSITLCGYLTSISASRACICLVSIAGFAAAQAASFQLWQRYNEPFVLIMLIILSTLLASHQSGGTESPRAPTDIATTRKSDALATASAPVYNDVSTFSPGGPLALLFRLRFAGPALLALALAALSWNTFSKAPPSDFYDLKPGEARTKAFLKGDPSIKPVPLPTK